MRVFSLVTLALAAIVSMACGPQDPEKLYADLGCPRCHGFHLEGNRYGPALDRLEEDWDSAETIGTYLRDPQPIVENDPRLSAQDTEYELKMQKVVDASDKDLAVLAKWLLEAGKE